MQFQPLNNVFKSKWGKNTFRRNDEQQSGVKSTLIFTDIQMGKLYNELTDMYTVLLYHYPEYGFHGYRYSWWW